jgi:phage FluMu gp28-like protein
MLALQHHYKKKRKKKMSNEIKLYTPSKFQLPVHNACNDDETFFITVCSGRQSGKTALSQQQALYWSLKHNGVLVYWVSPTAAQAIKVYKQILEMIINYPFIKSHKGSQGDTEIIFTNGSIIKFRSAQQENSLRGETVDYLILDEAAFIKASVTQEILLPMLNVRGKKVLSVSTPKGKNAFYTQYNRGFQGDKRYKSFKFTSMDNPYSSKDIIEIAKQSLPDVLFRQEYLGEFIDSAAIFENINELATHSTIDKPVLGDTYYCGVDIALKDDYSVVVIFNQNNEVVAYKRWNHITAPQLKENLVNVFNLWKPKKIYIEENNQGLPIIDDLKITHKVSHIQGFKTTSSSKPDIINKLINAFASKKIRIPNDDIFKNEFEMFTMTISENGTAKFSAPNGFHDDIVMATAIGWECVNKFKYSGTDFAFINI